jgi:hypothetical protein
MLKAEKPEIVKAVNDLFDAASNLNRGDVLTWETIEEATGVEKETGSWWQILNRFRRRLRNERNIEMWPQRTVGLELLTTQRQADSVGWRRKRAFRQTTRARKAIFALERESNLPMHVRKRIAAEKIQLASDRRQLRRSQNAVNKTQVNPVRKHLVA